MDLSPIRVLNEHRDEYYTEAQDLELQLEWDDQFDQRRLIGKFINHSNGEVREQAFTPPTNPGWRKVAERKMRTAHPDMMTPMWLIPSVEDRRP